MKISKLLVLGTLAALLVMDFSQERLDSCGILIEKSGRIIPHRKGPTHAALWQYRQMDKDRLNGKLKPNESSVCTSAVVCCALA